MPVLFLLSAIAAGSSVVILMEIWISKAWSRRLSEEALIAMGKISFWALVVYLAFRLGDLVIRGQFVGAFSGRSAWLFVAEIILGGFLPLALFAALFRRFRLSVLTAGASLCALGVVFNRINVVLWAMDLKGPMPQNAPASYSPSIV